MTVAGDTDLRKGVSRAGNDVLDVLDRLRALPDANRNDSIVEARRQVGLCWNTPFPEMRRSAAIHAAARLLLAAEIMDEEA